jgi:signal transduction histidine kinase
LTHARETLASFKEITMTTTEQTARPNSYLALWRGVPRELGFLFLTLPIALVGFVLTITLFSVGAGTLVTFFIGIVFLVAALYVSRGFGVLELVRLEWAGRPRIERPVWEQAQPGFWGWMRSTLGNGHYWLYLLHTMIINFTISTITWSLIVTWVATGLGGVTYWIWDIFLPQGDSSWHLSYWFLQAAGVSAPASNYEFFDGLVYFVVGIIALATLPFATRGFVLLHYGVAYGNLGTFRSDALRRQVGDLTASRGAAISAEGHSLRRLERDIHDGPQQRLVRLQMDLAAAERQLDADPEKARGLIAEAMEQSKDALEELRSLSRGFAPPLLLDRGLVAAIESAGDRSPVPVKIVDELGGVALPQEIERNAYFVVSESLANVAKHSGATEATVRVWVHGSESLNVAIFDNGRGGAAAKPNHGIAGLEERLHGLGGTLDVHSPAGGPTTVLAHLPLPTST